MTVGLIGLGRMGQSIAARLIHGGINVIGYDPYAKTIDVTFHGEQSVGHSVSFTRVNSLGEVSRHARIIWLMVPQGKPVDDLLSELIMCCNAGDIIIDGGNSFYRDTIRRHAMLKEKSLSYLDCGTSGGLQGREIGFSLMIGGDAGAFEKCTQLFKVVAAKQGYALVGPSGAGHYVKMVHNGIEYGLLQAYAEGFHLLRDGHYKNLDLSAICDVWNHGSIIRSWILSLSHAIFARDQALNDISGEIGENLTGKWTVDEAENDAIPVAVIKTALEVRASSRVKGGNYATKVVALLRHEFGGHPFTVIGDKKEEKK